MKVVQVEQFHHFSLVSSKDSLSFLVFWNITCKGTAHGTARAAMLPSVQGSYRNRRVTAMTFNICNFIGSGSIHREQVYCKLQTRSHPAKYFNSP